MNTVRFLNWKPLGKDNTLIYKGIAILMIVFHNFMHVFPIPKENEFQFSSERFVNLLHMLWNEPENSLRVVSSYFGHYGVQIFIFLSAYGLTKKYLKRDMQYWVFIKERVTKLLPVFFLAIVFWALITGWGYHGIYGPFIVVQEYVQDVFAFAANPTPGVTLIPVGPWWFIPFIFEFYFIFPFLLYVYSKKGGIALLIFSILGIVLSMTVHGRLFGFNIYYTILGHISEFSLGIYLAKNDNEGMKMPLFIPVIALFLFFFGNVYEPFWHLSHLSFLIIMIVILDYLSSWLNSKCMLNSFLRFFGVISMPLFLVSGFLRKPFVGWAMDVNNWALTIVLCLLSVTISVVLSIILSKVEASLSLLYEKIRQRD